MTSSTQAPWQISEGDFPRQGSLAEKLRFLVGYAVLAPSSHNAQPWRFTVREDSVELHVDSSRRQPVVDPNDRELLISCGAALFNLRVALRHFGIGDVTRVLPQPDDADLLAVVEAGGSYEPTPRDDAMFGAIGLRRTNRRAFEDRPLEPDVLPSLECVALAEGAHVREIEHHERAAIADLVAEADRVQMTNGAIRSELAAWLTPNHSARKDGVPGYAFGMPLLQSYFSSFMVKTFNLGNSLAKRDRQSLEHAAALVVLATDGDAPEDWLHAGQAVEALLLEARSEGVWASFVNTPLEIPSMRTSLRERLDIQGWPQLLLRLGYTGDVLPTPRRSAAEVISA